MRNYVVFAFVATVAVSAMSVALASAPAAGAVEMAFPVSCVSATTLAFNPQPDPPGREEEDYGFGRG